MAEKEAHPALAPPRFARFLYHTAVAGVAIGFVATAYQVVGLAGHLGDPAARFLLIGALVIGLGYPLVRFAALPVTTARERVLWLAIVAVVVFDVLLGLTPPTARDELTHHLAVPRLYAERGRIFEIPFSLPSYYPMLLDMLYIPFAGGPRDFIPKVIHGAFGFLTGALLYGYLSLRLSPAYGLLGWFFFASTPVVMRLASQAYVDLGLAFFATASLLGTLVWKETRGYRWLITAGLSAGFALATKPNGILFFVIAYLLLLKHLGPSAPLRAWGPKALLFAACALAAFGPWLARNYVWTGNPLFPFLADWFGGEPVSADPGLGVLATRRLLYGESWWEIALVPVRLFFFGRDDDPRRFDGVLNPMLIVFLPWAFRGKWRDEKIFLFLFALCYLVYAVFLADLRTRYVLPIVPPLVILLVYAVHNIYLRISRPRLLFAALLGLVSLNVAYAASYFARVSAAGYLLGIESRDEYLTRFLPEYPIFLYANSRLPRSARVYLVFVGRRAYYLRRDYFHDYGELPRFLVDAIDKAAEPKALADALKRKDLTHLVVRENLLRRFLVDNLSPQKLALWESFAARSLRRLAHANDCSLYAILG
ncbi:MAG TPA: glycosyltransferase family 39 protein [Candidatus Acidoferrales bacterium]|nr:glycosyltransferase family 39 protein [Candidatus Acidoferrales bacterium]